MGITQSLPVSNEAALTAVAVAGAAIGLGIAQLNKSSAPSQPAQEPKSSKKAKGKNKKISPVEAEIPAPTKEEKPAAPPETATVPGQFDPSAPIVPASKKSKKKKKTKPVSAAAGSTAADEVHSESSVDPTPTPAKPKRQKKQPQQSAGPVPIQQSVSIDTDGSWTRVAPKRRTQSLSQSEDAGVHDLSTTSDAGMSSSPVDEIRPVQPRPGEKPAEGFSWGDYEDVRIYDDTAADDDDEGWGVVQSKSRSRASKPTSSGGKAPETMSKRQRQNAQKRLAQKAAKAEIEADQLARLAQHRREQEKEKIKAAYDSGKGGKKNASGGMTASIEGGKLVWE